MYIPQTNLMKQAYECDPETWWWIKGDGVDVVKGLKESVRGLWSGDADLNDGTLATLRLKYDQRLKATANLGLGGRGTLPLIETDLNGALQELDSDLSFIHSGKYIVCTYMYMTKHHGRARQASNPWTVPRQPPLSDGQ